MIPDFFYNVNIFVQNYFLFYNIVVCSQNICFNKAYIPSFYNYSDYF